VIHGSNTAYWKKLFRNVKVQPVTDKDVITDGNQSIDVYTTDGDSHSDELLVGAAPPNPIPPDALVLYDNIQRRKLEVATIVGIHGRGSVPFSEFLTCLGKAAL
jgi:hypothetical protein